MTLLKYFFLIFLILTLGLLSTIVRAEDTNIEKCSAPEMTADQKISINCLFVEGKSYSATLKLDGLTEWELEEKISDFLENNKNSCPFDINNCVTVSGKLNSSIEYVRLPTLLYRDRESYPYIITLEVSTKDPNGTPTSEKALSKKDENPDEPR